MVEPSAGKVCIATFFPFCSNVEVDFRLRFNLAKGRVDLEAFGAYGASGQKDLENSFVVHIRSAWVSRRLLSQGCQAAGEDSGQEWRQQGRRRIQAGLFSAQKTLRRKIWSATSRGSRPSVETLYSARR